MRRTHHPTLSNPLEERIKKLDNDLYLARTAILSLIPESLRSALTSYYRIQSRDDSYQWEDDVAQQVIEHAKTLPRPSEYFAERATCPLCGGGSSSPYEEGYSLPEGLRRHLVGYGNTRQCVVSHAALALARDYWNSKFQALEEAEERARQSMIQQRKKTEMLYRTEPNGEPKLLDDIFSVLGAPRDQQGLAWAEKRLEELGFSISIDNGVKAYTSDAADFVVYADPRQNGQIAFRLFTKPPAKKRQSNIERAGRHFSIPDKWKT